MLYLDDYDLRRCQLSDRRQLLEELQVVGDGLRLVDVFAEDGELLFEHAKQLGFEGIVAKKLSSVYLPGKRSLEWQKVKNLHTEDFIIGGFTEGEGSRGESLGSFLLGKPENGKIRFVGSSEGGFNEKQLKEYTAMLRKIERKDSPFSGKVDLGGKIRWVELVYWAEVSFQTYTSGGYIRIPVFQRMREDLVGPNAKGPCARTKAAE